MMKACILLGNTREKSNTETVSRVFADELSANGVEVRFFKLREMSIHPCVGCETCHSIPESFGCVLKDDMGEIAEAVLASDLLVLTSPIYSWLPTPSLKAVMDRLFAFTKYPEDAEQFSLMKKQKIALIATSADECAENCDLLDEAVSRLARFSGLQYLGYFAAQDKGYEYITGKEVESGARAFARNCIENRS